MVLVQPPHSLLPKHLKCSISPVHFFFFLRREDEGGMKRGGRGRGKGGMVAGHKGKQGKGGKRKGF